MHMPQGKDHPCYPPGALEGIGNLTSFFVFSIQVGVAGRVMLVYLS